MGTHDLRRVVLKPDGKSVEYEESLGIFTNPLDVAVGSDGAIYVGDYSANTIEVMEPTPTLFDTGIWETQTPLPVPTQEVGSVACNGKVYVLGGIIGQNSAGVIDTNQGWAYDPNAKTWAPIADYPGAAVDHPGAACLDGKVYLIGGLIRAGVAVKAVYAYDIAGNSWMQKADLPQPRGAAGVAVYGGKIYVVGGLGYPDKSDLYVYDPASNTWVAKAPMPTARDHLIFKEIGGKLYALGGRTAVTIQSATAVNEVYNPATDTWQGAADGIAPMPFARAAMAAGTLHGQIQIWGGEAAPGAPNADAAGINPQGQMYDPKTNTWITIANELTPRHGTDGATINDQLFVPGGAVHQGNAATEANDMFAFVSADPVGSCIAAGSDPNATDSDNDAYTNRDELDNDTDPCSAAATPPDNDGDHVSDLNDPDDDNDGVLDTADQYQFDAANGTATQLPWIRNWNPGDPPEGKFGNSGFPGVQLTSNGAGFIADKVHPGGAGGLLTLYATGGSNYSSSNNQDNALQVGFDARQTVTIQTRIADPFNGVTPDEAKSGGIFFGLDEDNYIKLVVVGKTPTTARVVFAVEHEGNYSTPAWIKPVDVNVGNGHTLDLFLVLDPATQRVVAQYRDTNDDPAAIITIGEIDTRTSPWMAKLFKLGAAAGVLSSNTSAATFGVAFDYFKIEPSTAPPQQLVPVVPRIYLPFVRR
jgi:N-acetylneuraminic acid mutarotase